MQIAIGYVGKGEYRVFLGSKVVGIIRTLKENFCPRALTGKGEKLGQPVKSLAAAKFYIERKLNKHGV